MSEVYLPRPNRLVLKFSPFNDRLRALALLAGCQAQAGCDCIGLLLAPYTLEKVDELCLPVAA